MKRVTTVMLSAIVAAAASLSANAQLNKDIVDKLEANDDVTSVYLSRGMLKNVRFALSNQLGGSIDFMSVPLPYDIQSMHVLDCGSESSIALAKELVARWLSEHKNAEQMGRVKDAGGVTTVYGIKKDVTEEGEVRLGAILFDVSSKDGRKIIYCEGRL